ncbi:N-acetylmuramoyl-L-alanine amidase [Bacillus aryabhattai]|uniref:N-acetylmuramoyl-L-alanine amidase n=1 Tax=Priestia aryabhattai TaxID=412384 RepID=A0A7W3NE19_PRIAR|nr:N-acetylmuramoyl-L-alanine amidase [Priestia aryabhattai]MUL33522.1 Cell wall hydrolase CwlJ [Priestia megaterium]
MAVVAHNEEDVKLLARLIRAEAESEGKQGMFTGRKCRREPR